MNINVFNSTGLTPAPTTDLTELRAMTKEVIWIDVHPPTVPEMDILREQYNFHPLAIEDALLRFQRPKVDEYADHLFIIANHLVMYGRDLRLHELDIFLGKEYFVTVHRHCETLMKEVHSRIARSAIFKHQSSEYLLYIVMDTLVDAYFPVLDKIDAEIEEMSERVLSNPTPRLLTRLFELKRMLNETWRVATQQRDMFTILTRREADLLINHDVLEYYLRDVHDHLLRVADMISTSRDNLNGVIELYVSATANHLNFVVNRLAIITIGIGVFTVISGFYGMNFEHTWPPFSEEWGVLFVLGLMAALVGLLLFIFKRLDWY